ncbi:MAG: nitroreductase family protein [Syntrophales bacterium]|jgi:nitroreductase
MMKDLVAKNRSYRRFDESFSMDEKVLRELVDIARLTASAANFQPLKYILSWTKMKNDRIFPNLAWAGNLKEWPGPAEGERPTAYIVLLLDKERAHGAEFDAGIATQTILLGAAEKGLGGCMIASVNRKSLRKDLGISDRYEIILVIALGKPIEHVIIDTVGVDGNIKYWRDADGGHHVPKRSLEDIILPF